MNYNRNSRSGGGFSRGGDFRGGGRRGGGGFDRRDSGPREMHKAVCDECGKNCEVPFRPSGDKPIYCSDCFEKRNGGESNRSDRRGSGKSGFARRDSSSKELLEQFSALNTKLDKILHTLESSTDEKPVAKKPQPKKTPTKKVVKKSISKDKEKIKT